MNAYGAKNVKGVTDGTSTPIGTSGITYNFLDKQELIRIQGKGVIQIIYDADGNKLQRKFTPETGAVSITTYINEFVYQNDSLSFINFEEGRIRVLNAFSANNGYDGLSIDGNMDLPNGKRGGYDYFIRDYQQNVRMILTEETHYGINQATMEPERAGNEEPYFGQAGAGNEVVATRTSKPAGWNSNTSNNVSKLSKLTGHTIGPNSLLKVMAGDVFNAKADYYYPAPVTNNSNPLIGDIVTALMAAITGNPAASGAIHGGTSNISNDLTASVPFKSIADPHQTGADNIPRAYLNIMFFNERFEFVQEGSTVLRVSQPGGNASPLVLSNIKAPKNGYVYIYLSNENDDAVYFDNFAVSYTRGRIVEENHYYAFGLRIAGISSKKFDGGMEGNLINHYLYNDKELFEDADLNWYDYGFRNYDPQIGRFTQLDPLTWDYPYYTPYQYAGDEPIANVDLDGLEPYQVLGEVIVYKVMPNAAKTAGATSKISSFFSQAARIAVKAVDVATDFIPVVSGVKDIFQGAVNGSWTQVGIGIVGIGVDVVTFGGGSIAKGAIKTAVKEGAEIIAKDVTEQVIKREGSQLVNKSVRQRAVREAWKEEKALVKETGQGTREWTEKEAKELLENGKVKDYQGHHINNVKHHPSQAGNPDNIKFVTRKEHLLEHGGNFKNKTTGELLNRKTN